MIKRNETLIDQKFNDWTVIDVVFDKNGRSKRYRKWKCQCKCGYILIIEHYRLKNNKTKHCKKCEGLARSPHFIGKRVNQWTLLEFIGGTSSKWKCLCDCGNTRIMCGKYIEKSIHCKKCRIEAMKGTYKGKNIFTGKLNQGHFNYLKNQAINRKHEFNLTIEYLSQLFDHQKEKCALTGLDINFAKTYQEYKDHITTASLDRIHSSKGYIEGNVQWVHKKVNFMKHVLSQSEFIDICKLVAQKFENS